MADSKIVREVKDLLEKGRYYEPADKLVSRLSLALCKEGDQDLLKSLIKATCDLARSTGRGKGKGLNFCKKVANELNILEVVDREWIVTNIHKLPPIKVTKEQIYEPLKQTKDLRLEIDPQIEKVVSDAGKGAECEEMEVEFELDLSAHSSLLNTPEGEKGRSPRISPVKIVVSPAVIRISPVKAQLPEQISRKTSRDEQQPSTSEDQHQPSAGNGKRLKRASCSNNPEERRVFYSEEAGGSGRLTISKGVSYSTDKSVSKTNMVPLNQDTLASGGAMEGVALHYGYKRTRTCIIPGCGGNTRYPKVHAFREHVPSIFDERLPPDDEEVLERRKRALVLMTTWMLGRPGTLDELAECLRMQRVLELADNVSVSDRLKLHMEAFLPICWTCDSRQVYSVPTQFYWGGASL
ncbi:uncharacterized protein LOC128205464 [Mya arenaria]|uniref:uncharacterized protein LOC128205464 n=1 Tax=Mya arenaria TaxID=6604 RepID=UPI0022E61BF0|nr:uncharacterized protein LOC128205464 [Mya arenaria]